MILVTKGVCVLFTLTDRASAIPSNIPITWLPMRYVVCWTGKDQRNIYSSTKLQREHENKNKTKNDKKRGTITQSTCQKKIEVGHLIERVCYTASCEPSDPIPSLDRNHAPKRIASTTPVLLRFQVSLSHSRRCLGQPLLYGTTKIQK